MDKPLLLQRLSIVRARAEAAHLEVVLNTAAASRAKEQGSESEADVLALAYWKMAEQKALRELDWLLDQLDALERDR